MSSLNGRPELISLLQYMKNTTLDNPTITVKDERIVDLDRIVGEVKQSEEWEAVKMNILEIGIEKGREEGREEGRKEGIEEGRKEGKTEKQTEIIQNMIKSNLSCSKISEITGIPLDVIEEVERGMMAH